MTSLKLQPSSIHPYAAYSTLMNPLLPKVKKDALKFSYHLPSFEELGEYAFGLVERSTLNFLAIISIWQMVVIDLTCHIVTRNIHLY